MRKLRISPDLTIPLDIVTQRTSCLGRTGSGKTYAAGKIVEEVLKAKQQVAIFDVKDDWYGLRSGADGKTAGLPITILGGHHGDLPLDPGAGAFVADLIIAEGLSVILSFDLFETKADENRFATDFADRLYRKNRNPLLLVVDEADQFMPQNPMPDERRMLSKFEVICRRGRKRGLGVLLMSQRSAAIHKGPLSQTELMLAFQTTDPRDRAAIEDWVREKAGEFDREEFHSRLKRLKTGRAIAWSPVWLDVYKEVGFARKETYDSSATPTVGMRRRAPRVLAPVDLERLKGRMTETLERAEREDPKRLQAKLAQVEREIKEARRQLEVRKGVPAKLNVPARQAPETKIVEKPILGLKEIRAVRKAAGPLVRALGRVEKAVAPGKRLFESLEGAVAECGKATEFLNGLEMAARNSVERAQAVHLNVRTVSPSPNKIEMAPRASHDSQPKNGELIEGERKMLAVAVQFFPGTRTRSQIGQLAGYTPRGGTFKQYDRRLRRLGYWEEDSDGAIRATDKGIAYFGSTPPTAPARAADKLSLWYGKLIQGERKMLEVVAGRYPGWITFDEWGHLSGYDPGGGTFKQYQRTLKRNDLVEIQGRRVRGSATICEDS